MKQILEERKELSKKKGTVLLTVVGVMMVLVVFLLSTLVLTASSSRRSYYTYYETQAQYAAQAALDAVTNSAYSNKNFYQYVSQKVTSVGEKHDLKVSFDVDETQKSNIQFTDPEDKAVYCTIERMPDNYVWDEDTKAIHAQHAWKITATASVGNGRNQADYTAYNYIYETYRAPEEGLNSGIQNKADSTVYTGSKKDESQTAISIGTVQLGSAGISGNVKYLGPQITGQSRLPVGRGKYTNAADYSVKLGNNNLSIGNILFVNNVDIAVEAAAEFQRAGEYAIYYGNVTVTNNGYGWNTNIAAPFAPTSYNTQNYVYIDGMLTVGIDCSVGATSNRTLGSHPANFFGGAVQCTQDGSKFFVHGDAFLYDPDLESVLYGKSGSETYLTTFMENNLTKNNVFENNGQGASGNLFCNNKKLKIGGQNDGYRVAGDLIFTNPNGTLEITKQTWIGGQVYCAGTLVGEEFLYDIGTNARLDSSKIHTTASTDKVDNYFDSAYVTYSRDGTGADYSKLDYNTRLFPFQYRLDEIFPTYYRWDLQSENPIDIDALRTTDAQIKESYTCGHDWQVAAFPTPGGTTYVPFTNPKNTANSFIEDFTYLVPTSEMAKIQAAGFEVYDDKTAFLAKVGGTTLKSDTGTEQVQLISHSAAGAMVSPKLNVKYVNENCTLNAVGGTVLIDPSTRANKNEPLYIYLTNSMAQKKDTTIYINNTASYATGKTPDDNGKNGPTPYYNEKTPATSTVASHGEVYIFLEPGVNLAGVKLLTTGMYQQQIDGTLYIVQNPIYPSNSNFINSAANYKFAYELVPNAIILGQKDTTYQNFAEGFFWNAEILMPTARLKYGTPNFVNPTIYYREEWNSGTTTATNNYVMGVGAAIVDGADAGDPKATIAYIGDRNRSEEEKKEYGNNSSDLGADNKDYLKNDHQGNN